MLGRQPRRRPGRPQRAPVAAALVRWPRMPSARAPPCRPPGLRAPPGPDVPFASYRPVVRCASLPPVGWAETSRARGRPRLHPPTDGGAAQACRSGRRSARTSRSAQTGRWSDAATRPARSRSTGRCGSTSSGPPAKITSSRWRGWRAVKVGAGSRHRPQPSGERAPRPAVLPLVEVAGDDERAVGGKRAENGADVPGALVGVEAEVDADDVDSRVPRQRHRRERVAPLALQPWHPQPLVAGHADVDAQRGQDRRPAAAAVRSGPHQPAAPGELRDPVPGERVPGHLLQAEHVGVDGAHDAGGRGDVVLAGRARCTTRPAATSSTSAAGARRARRPGPGRPRRSARRRCRSSAATMRASGR